VVALVSESTINRRAENLTDHSKKGSGWWMGIAVSVYRSPIWSTRVEWPQWLPQA